MSDPILVPPLGMTLSGAQPVDPVGAPHWKAASEGVLTVPTCEECGTNYWPVVHACYVCGSLKWSWQPVSGTGRVFTFTWLDAPTHSMAELQNVAVIELDGVKGEPVRVPGWVVGVDKSSLACDMAVEVEFETIAEDVAVPHWRPRVEPA